MPKRGRAPFGSSTLPAAFFEGKVEHPWRNPEAPLDINEFWKWQEESVRRRSVSTAKQQPTPVEATKQESYPDPAILKEYQDALAEWRALRSKPFASRTPADDTRYTELFKFISSFNIPD